MVSISNFDVVSVGVSNGVYENMTESQSIDEVLADKGLEDSGNFEQDSPSNSNEQIDEHSCSPMPSSFTDDKHIYTNIKEMNEINNKSLPPIPEPGSQPKRNLNNGWFEYETDVGRTYFHNPELEKSQWIPPRFIRTPAEVQAFLKATRDEINENFTTTTEEPEISEQSEDVRDSKDYDVPRSLLEECNARSRNSSGKVSEPEHSTHSSSVKKDPDVVLTSFSSSAVGSDLTALVQGGPSSTTKSVHSSPSMGRSQSVKNRYGQLKNVPLPQVLPTTSSNYPNFDGLSLDKTIKSADDRDDRRTLGGIESREPVRTIRSGNMEMTQWNSVETVVRTKRREWQVNFLFLTSAHLILYKDQKSAEKLGNHYGSPIGVCDLRGGTVSWNIEKERKKRKVIQLEMSYGPKYLLRTPNDNETKEWFDALREVICNLPAAAPTTGLPLHSSVIDQSCAVVRNPSTLSHRPHSTSLLSTSRLSKKNDVMAQSSIEQSTQYSTCDETSVSRQTILERLKRFFRTRPTVESLKEKGIYKPEPVFGSTLASICQLENTLVPKFIRTVTELIEDKGLEVDGLYRVSGNLSAVQRIRCQVDQDKYNALVNEEDVHVLTGSLKLFFRELAEPVFPMAMTKDFLSANQVQQAKLRFKKFDELLKSLPPENRETLKLLLRHLHRVAAHSDKNRMQTHNLAIMFGPTLFYNGEEKTKKENNKKSKKDNKKEEPAPVQSNSHLAFHMIMQGQIVEYLLNEHNRFEALQGPVQKKPS
ncbi:unnamed protein product [Auanema sp. JU1783]|nr:unnamed protein product [Auanema sp. JU1783]